MPSMYPLPVPPPVQPPPVPPAGSRPVVIPGSYSDAQKALNDARQRTDSQKRMLEKAVGGKK